MMTIPGNRLALKAEALRLRSASWTCSGRRPAVARSVSFSEDVFPNEKQGEKKRAHGENAEREEEQDAGEFAHEVFVARNGLGQDGVNGAVFQIARDELSRRHDCEKRAEDAHRA